MMKKISLLLVLIILCTVTVSAVGPSLVVDDADLLTDTQISALTDKLESLSRDMNMDVVFVTTDTTGASSAMEYADDYYDYNGYGKGAGDSGVLLLISMDTREYWISTCGYAITVLTDYGIDYIKSEIVGYLSSGDYYGAANRYADLVKYLYDFAQNGEPYDVNNDPAIDRSFKTGFNGAIAAVIGLITGGITTGIMKGKNKSVVRRNEAADYIIDSSVNISRSKDHFLYSNVSRTAIQTSSGSSSGGSSTHHSSSGVSHGGGGGRF